MTALPTTPSPRSVLAWSALGLALIGAVAMVIESPTLESVISGGMFIAFPVVGLLLQARVPNNAVGSVLLAIGACAGVGGYRGRCCLPGSGRLFRGRRRPMDPDLALLSDHRSGSRLAAAVPLRAPCLEAGAMGPGRPLLFVLMTSVGAALYPWPADEGGPNPLAVEGMSSTWLFLQDVAGLPLLVAALAGITTLIVRFRRGTQVERQQIKWFLAASALLPLAIGIGDEYREIQGIVVPIAFILFPLAIGVAITRYRLYDIDRIVSRTVTYAAVTALLIGAYLTVVFALGRLFPSQDSLAVVASTLTVAALFNPVRRRIQRSVDQYFNRPRYDAERTIEEFGRRLRGEGTPLDSLEEELVMVVAGAMQPASVSVWVKDQPGESRERG